jgi:prepilin-type N-terminal cleavage/methylation domain-containing protein
MHHKRHSAGFTLIELAIALAVAGILAAALVPDFIEMARNDLAETAAADIVQLEDASRWFYRNSNLADPTQRRWPGQAAVGVCNIDPVLAQQELIAAGYATAQAFTTPWAGNYRLAAASIAADNCGLRVDAEMPANAAGAVTQFVPVLNAIACPPALGAGNASACSVIPAPGKEAFLNTLDPPAMTSEICAGLGGVLEASADGDVCRMVTAASVARCFWRTSCNGVNEVVNNMRCTGKDCSTLEVQCCQSQN